MYAMVLLIMEIVKRVQIVKMDQMRILIFAVERPKELMIKMVFIMKTIVIHMFSGNVLMGKILYLNP